MRPQRGSLLRRLLQLTALSAFAVGHPVLEKLGGSPEFFAARRSGAGELLLLAAALLLLLPLLLALPGLLVSALNPRAGRVWHQFTLATLLAVTFAPPLEATGVLHGWWVPGGATLAALAATVALFRHEGARRFCSALALFALVSGAYFLARPEIRELLRPDGTRPAGGAPAFSRTPVVVVVFDEFPLSALLDNALGIDAARFPHFADLAAHATWFRDATAVSTHTMQALPAILTGVLPSMARRLPTARSHPDNLFTLLSATHRMHVREAATALYPLETAAAGERFASLLSDVAAVALNLLVPPDIGIALPTISLSWGGFWGGRHTAAGAQHEAVTRGRIAAFRRWTREIDADDRPALHFSHHLLPHAPYQFLPSGAFSGASGMPYAYRDSAWLDDDRARALAYQQFFAQVGACDTLLGELVARLRATGLYDKSLVVVTADHGITFAAGAHRRGRASQPSFYEDLLSIPLFVKLPGQAGGAVSERAAESVDILPTIAAALGGAVPWDVDGTSLFDGQGGSRAAKRLVVGEKKRRRPGADERPSYELLTFPVPAAFPRATLDWKLGLFPTPPPTGSGRFALAPPTHPVDPPAGTPRALLTLLKPRLSPGPDGTRRLSVSRASGTVPAYFQGTLLLDADPADLPGVAVVVNGRLAALVPAFRRARDAGRTLSFEALVDEGSLPDGPNAVELYLVGTRGGAASFEPVRWEVRRHHPSKPHRESIGQAPGAPRAAGELRHATGRRRRTVSQGRREPAALRAVLGNCLLVNRISISSHALLADLHAERGDADETKHPGTTFIITLPAVLRGKQV